MKIKTSELSGIALDWAVAKCEAKDGLWLREPEFVNMRLKQGIRPSKYSSDWSQGGPIIERQGIWLGVHSNDECGAWYPMHQTYYGTTYLEAAMRCYVASKLGEEVEVPDDLL